MAGAWLAAAAFGAALVQGGDGKVPTGKWVVNFEESRCVASREYGSPDRLLTLALKAPVKGDVIQLVVLRDSRNAASAQQVEGSVGLPGAVKPVSALTFATTDGKRRVYLLNLPMSEVEGWGDGGALTLRAGSGLDESLRVSGLRPLLKVMRECVADLGRHWNYAGKDGPPKVRQEPKGSLVSIFSANDYPAEAIRKELQGTVSVVVLIDEAGKVADCTLLETSGVAALDAQTCAIIGRRARYKPAIGLDGKPARSVDVGRIRWVMPD